MAAAALVVTYLLHHLFLKQEPIPFLSVLAEPHLLVEEMPHILVLFMALVVAMVAAVSLVSEDQAEAAHRVSLVVLEQQAKEITVVLEALEPTLVAAEVVEAR